MAKKKVYPDTLVEQVTAARNEGLSLADISEKFKVPYGTINGLIKRGQGTRPKVTRARRGSSLEHQVRQILAMRIPDTVKLLAIDGLVN
jgi:transposase